MGVATQHASYATPAILGCFFNATPFHTVNPIYSKETIQHIFNITKPKVIFCDGSIYNVMSVATKMWNPLIYILDDHMEGIANIQDLLEPTTTEIFYEYVTDYANLYMLFA